MRFLSLPLFFVALTPLVRADEPKPVKALDVGDLDKFIAGKVKDTGYVGLSVAIMENGKIIFAKGYGHSSLKNEASVDAKTMFGAGSVTKQFTCACILLLAEDGKLSVRDKVAKYFPDLTRAKDITLHDLMSHVSGYPDYYPLDFVDRRMEKPIALDKLIQEYAGGKLDFEPGTRWSYSNTGYSILGRVIEKVSGKPFDKFLEERILKPLSMENTAFEPKPEAKNVAIGFTSFALGKPEEAAREANGWIHAAGGLFTTPTDLAKWDLALMEGKLLKPESFRLMTTPRKLADGRTKNYGCGLGIQQRDGETILRHSGAVSGYLAFNTMFPRTQSAVALLTNCDHLDAGALNDLIVARLIKAQAAEAPAVPKIAGLAPKDAALEIFHQMQSGEIKRDNLAEEFSHFLNEKRVDGAKERLKALGEPEKVEVVDVSERGGFEFAVIRFTFKTAKAKAYLYRSTDGKIQQFLLYGS